MPSTCTTSSDDASLGSRRKKRSELTSAATKMYHQCCKGRYHHHHHHDDLGEYLKMNTTRQYGVQSAVRDDTDQPCSPMFSSSSSVVSSRDDISITDTSTEGAPRIVDSSSKQLLFYDSWTCDELLNNIEDRSNELEKLKSKTKRRKKISKIQSKVLIKLCTILKRRSSESQKKDKQISRLDGKIKSLENIIQKAKIDLETQVVTAKSLSLNHAEETIKAQNEYRSRCDSRITELQQMHDVQIKELLRGINRSRLEANRLRNHLEKIERQTSVLQKKKIATSVFMFFRRGVIRTAFMFIIIGLIILIAVNDYDWFSMDAVCAPVMPGSVLSFKKRGSFEAPWWVPEILKQPVFHKLCGTARKRIRISWNENLLTKSPEIHLDKVNDDGSQSLLQRWSADFADIRSDRMILLHRGGVEIQQVKSLWSPSTANSYNVGWDIFSFAYK